MASAEDRGRRAGERFFEMMKDTDPISAEIFRKIAEEEVERFYEMICLLSQQLQR